jgi:hypothetical protein
LEEREKENAPNRTQGSITKIGWGFFTVSLTSFFSWRKGSDIISWKEEI